MHMHTKLENGILRNGQQLGSAVNRFIDLGRFEAIKMLSGQELSAVISISFMLK